MRDNKKILIAVDASEAARRAVAYVADMLAGQPGFHVELFHLELPPKMLEWGGSEDPQIEARVGSERAAAYRDLENEVIEKGQSLLRRLQGMLVGKGIEATTLHVQFEEPLDKHTIAAAILNAANERGCGTVVVGHQCFSGLRRFFQHHVAEELIRNCKSMTLWAVE